MPDLRGSIIHTIDSTKDWSVQVETWPADNPGPTRIWAESPYGPVAIETPADFYRFFHALRMARNTVWGGMGWE